MVLNNNPKKVIVIDIETTSLNLTGSICEIGICFLNLKTSKILKIFDKVCREDKHIDPNAWIFNNSTLTYDEVKNAPLLETFRAWIQTILNLGHPVCAYNNKFDFRFLEDRGFKISEHYFDPMVVLNVLTDIMPKGDYKNKYPSVQEAWDYFYPDSEYVEIHRAFDDAYHEAQIVLLTYQKLRNKISDLSEIKKDSIAQMKRQSKFHLGSKTQVQKKEYEKTNE